MNDVSTVMMWPLLACVLLPGILVYMGLHIVRREIIFVDLALAQVAALGICMAILLGHDSHDWQTIAWSAAFTLVGAGILTALKPGGSLVPLEAFIGIVYVVAAAAGILLLSRSPEGNEELRRTLVGEVLLVNPVEVMRTFALFAAVGFIHVVFRRQFLQLTYGPHNGKRGWFWDFLFYALFGVVVTSFVRIGGVLLVFSYLIIPAVCATLLTGGILRQLVIGWLVATFSSVGGLYASYRLDLPTGAAVVCALGIVLLIISLCRLIIRLGLRRRPLARHGEVMD
jgi:zinc/manganese transport system permease protein